MKAVNEKFTAFIFLDTQFKKMLWVLLKDEMLF